MYHRIRRYRLITVDDAAAAAAAAVSVPRRAERPDIHTSYIIDLSIP